jgi:hypothetical protein
MPCDASDIRRTEWRVANRDPVTVVMEAMFATRHFRIFARWHACQNGALLLGFGRRAMQL